GVALERGQDELRNDGRVFGRRILTRAEDVEVAQADRLDAVQAIPHGGVLLAGQLRDAIGRDGRRYLRLSLGKIRTIAVDGRRRRVHHAANTLAPGRLEHVERARDVAGVGADRIRDRLRHRAHRRLVEDHPDAGRRRLDARLVTQVAPDDLQRRVSARERQVLETPTREVVEHAHGVAVGEQTIDDVRADEAGPPGDEKSPPHGRISRVRSASSLSAPGSAPPACGVRTVARNCPATRLCLASRSWMAGRLTPSSRAAWLMLPWHRLSASTSTWRSVRFRASRSDSPVVSGTASIARSFGSMKRPRAMMTARSTAF